MAQPSMCFYIPAHPPLKSLLWGQQKSLGQNGCQGTDITLRHLHNVTAQPGVPVAKPH